MPRMFLNRGISSYGIAHYRRNVKYVFDSGGTAKVFRSSTGVYIKNYYRNLVATLILV
jgi:hypothetical protein